MVDGTRRDGRQCSMIAVVTLTGLALWAGGFLRLASAVDEGLAASADFAIEAVGVTTIDLSDDRWKGLALDGSKRSGDSSVIGRVWHGAAVGDRLQDDETVARLHISEPTAYELVVVPLPASLWPGLGGLAMILGLRMRGGRVA